MPATTVSEKLKTGVVPGATAPAPFAGTLPVSTGGAVSISIATVCTSDGSAGVTAATKLISCTPSLPLAKVMSAAFSPSITAKEPLSKPPPAITMSAVGLVPVASRRQYTVLSTSTVKLISSRMSSRIGWPMSGPGPMSASSTVSVKLDCAVPPELTAATVTVAPATGLVD